MDGILVSGECVLYNDWNSAPEATHTEEEEKRKQRSNNWRGAGIRAAKSKVITTTAAETANARDQEGESVYNGGGGRNGRSRRRISSLQMQKRRGDRFDCGGWNVRLLLPPTALATIDYSTAQGPRKIHGINRKVGQILSRWPRKS